MKTENNGNEALSKTTVMNSTFAGSGTTAKMSILNKRNWIASEISSEYCEIIKERIKIDKGLFEKELTD